LERVDRTHTANADLAAQVSGALKELPDFELKQRENFSDLNFSVGVLVGCQRGAVDGCLLADALKWRRSP
jgi:hypothetical protein